MELCPCVQVLFGSCVNLLSRSSNYAQPLAADPCPLPTCTCAEPLVHFKTAYRKPTSVNLSYASARAAALHQINIITRSIDRLQGCRQGSLLYALPFWTQPLTCMRCVRPIRLLQNTYRDCQDSLKRYEIENRQQRVDIS